MYIVQERASPNHFRDRFFHCPKFRQFEDHAFAAGIGRWPFHQIVWNHICRLNSMAAEFWICREEFNGFEKIVTSGGTFDETGCVV